ncbi:branched-chain amino acid ABC transporter permease [Desulfospira joergensenii]|uniref:branched-chain amino acid ABC transporter permease n=1 Tax=Desulfospira joergensenii TaxID=53329 RepID=UPI0003B3F284|nr:branched-chain amino acid ABC transporter permease [Desulfospira joergensenii]
MFSEDTILLFYEITDVIIAGLSNGSVYALMAVGMTLVYGVTKAFNFAYGDFFNMGGYLAWILIVGLGLQFGGYFTVILIVMPILFGVGYGLEKFLVAPLRKRPDWENRVMMLTLGLGLFLSNLYMVVFGVKLKSLPPILDGILEIGQIVFSYQDIMIFVMSLGGILLFGWMLNNTRTGLAVRAVAQNPAGAKIVGINIQRVFAATFAISTVMVGFGGILLSQKLFINPTSGGAIMVKAWVVTAFGGMGSIRGGLYAAFIIGMMEAFVGWTFGMSYTIIALFVLLLATLVIRPQGLMGKGA